MSRKKLSSNDKEMLKNNLTKTLNEYKKFPSLINLSIDDSTEIKNKPNNLDIIRNLVFTELDNDCPIDKNDIIFNTIFLSGSGMARNYYSFYWTARGTYYYKIYMSQKELMIYSLDNYYRLLSSRKIPISQIASVGISNRDITGLKLSEENIILQVNADEQKHSSFYYFESMDNSTADLLKFNNFLLENGVHPYKSTGLSKSTIIVYCFLALVFLGLAITTIQNL